MYYRNEIERFIQKCLVSFSQKIERQPELTQDLALMGCRKNGILLKLGAKFNVDQFRPEFKIGDALIQSNEYY